MPNATSRAMVQASKSPTYGVVMSGNDTTTLSGTGVDFNAVGNVGLDLTVNPTTTPSQVFFGRTATAVSVTSAASPTATTVATVSIPNVTTQCVIEVIGVATEAAGSVMFRSGATLAGFVRVAGSTAAGNASSGGSFNFNAGTAAGSSPSAFNWTVGSVSGGATATNTMPIQLAITSAAGNTFNVVVYWRMLIPGAEGITVS